MSFLSLVVVDFTLFTSAKVSQVVGCLSHGFQDSIPAISSDSKSMRHHTKRDKVTFSDPGFAQAIRSGFTVIV